MIAMLTSPLAARIETSAAVPAPGYAPILSSSFFLSPIQRLPVSGRIVTGLFRYELCGIPADGKRNYPPEQQPLKPKTESDRVREQSPFKSWPNRDKIRVPSDW